MAKQINNTRAYQTDLQTPLLRVVPSDHRSSERPQADQRPPSTYSNGQPAFERDTLDRLISKIKKI